MLAVVKHQQHAPLGQVLQQYLQRPAANPLASTDRTQHRVDQLLGVGRARNLDHNGRSALCR